MNPAAEANLVVAPVPPDCRAAVLDLAFSHLPPTERQQQVEMTLSALTAGGVDQQGLLAAWRGGQLVGALWSQVQPGRSAEVWLPRVLPDGPESTASTLLEAVCQWLAKSEVRIAQVLLPAVTQSESALLRRWGFDHLADLLYLVCLVSEFPTSEPIMPLRFESHRPDNHQRLVAAVEATYHDTLDCPQLNGVRQIADVLAGYRGMGVFDPGRWLIVRHEDRDIGCLLLTDYPQAENYELVYMGVVPAARGHGWGGEIVRYAQWLTSQAGRPRLVAAVDAGNQPALRLYAAAGFRAWDRRSVYLKVF